MSLPVTAGTPLRGDHNPEQSPEDPLKWGYPLFDTARIDLVAIGVFDRALSRYDVAGGSQRPPSYGVVVLKEDR
ncbi:hypothetical protein ACGFIW_17720 [Micromonospora sp. NPDC048935]|uniref:hypothetical protein n=1 Tax=Micromonospora sp. NPDC048935 TaxID=3364262 RepID=UPI00371B7A41